MTRGNFKATMDHADIRGLGIEATLKNDAATMKAIVAQANDYAR